MRRFLSAPKSKPTIIFMVGGPSSGKSTQASLIENNLQFQRISVATLLKEESESPYSMYGQAILQSRAQNTPIPSKVILSLILTAIKCSVSRQKKFIVEDLRTDIKSMETWNTIMTEKSIIPFIIHLSCPKEVLMERTLNLERGGRQKIKQQHDEGMDAEKEILEMFMAAGKVIEINGVLHEEQVSQFIKESIMGLAVDCQKIQ